MQNGPKRDKIDSLQSLRRQHNYSRFILLDFSSFDRVRHILFYCRHARQMLIWQLHDTIQCNVSEINVAESFILLVVSEYAPEYCTTYWIRISTLDTRHQHNILPAPHIMVILITYGFTRVVLCLIGRQCRPPISPDLFSWYQGRASGVHAIGVLDGSITCGVIDGVNFIPPYRVACRIRWVLLCVVDSRTSQHTFVSPNPINITPSGENTLGPSLFYLSTKL